MVGLTKSLLPLRWLLHGAGRRLLDPGGAGPLLPPHRGCRMPSGKSEDSAGAGFRAVCFLHGSLRVGLQGFKKADR